MTDYFHEKGRALLANGYLIIPIKPGEKRPGIGAWQNARMSAADLANFPEHGIGILTGQGEAPVVGIDIDISHPIIGPAIINWCRSHTGWAPERIGAAPRTLIVYRADSAGWAKGNSVSFFDPSDPTKPSGKRNEQQIEVLGLGQQFVAYHTHPDTGRPYEWVDMMGGLEYVGVNDLPVISEVQIEQLFCELDRLVRSTAGLENVSAPASMPLSLADEDYLLGLVPKCGDISLEKAAEYLAQIDNSRGVSYDEWITVMMGLHHEFDGSPDALITFNEWSRCSPKHENGEAERKWKSLGKSGKQVSFRWIIKTSNIAKADREVAERRETVQKITTLISNAPDQFALTDTIAKQIRELLPTIPALRAEVLGKFQDKFRQLTGQNLPIADARRQLIDYQRAQADRKRHPLTEFGNAARMVEAFGSGIRYIPELASWIVWKGNHWARVSELDIEYRAKQTVTSVLLKEGPENAENSGDFYAFLSISQTAKMVKNMVTLAASDPGVMLPASELDKHPHYIGCRNGVVDLRTRELLPPDPLLYITKMVACDYKPEARCPLFERTVREAMYDDMEMVEFLYRFFGYVIQGDPKEDVMLIPFGSGANGKSTIIGVIRRTLGDYSRAADASSFVSDGKQTGGAGGAREDLVRLMGARMVYVNEPDDGGELREGSVKSMTGGDPITARGMYAKSSVEITAQFVVVMPTNHKPIIKQQDDGIWRRVMPMPFERSFDNDKTIVKDPNREDRLLDEIEGIFALLVRWGIVYRNSGLNPPLKIRNARENYRRDMDLLAEWLDERCEVGQGFHESSNALWLSWENFAKNRGILNYVKNAISLGRRLDQRFPAKKLPGGARVRDGIRLKTDFEALSG